MRAFARITLPCLMIAAVCLTACGDLNREAGQPAGPSVSSGQAPQVAGPASGNRESGSYERKKHDLFYFGPDFPDWGPGETYDEYKARVFAACDGLWRKCLSGCGDYADPIQRENCSIGCNKSARGCTDVP